MNNPSTSMSGINRFYAKVYGFLGMGLALSAVTSYLALWVFPLQLATFINNFPLGFVGLWIVELILVMVLGVKAQKNPSLAIGGFIAYSLLNGITLAVTLAYYDIGTVTQAFLTATLMFMGMSVVGVTTKRDLSGVGRAGQAALIGVIIALVLNIFILRSSVVELFISLLLVVIFSGITAYDNQSIRNIYVQTNGTAHSGIAVFMALKLYLDFINLFLAFLRIFGRNN
ncbi:TPA: Bax inhibitor-1/YccA family protein [Enterococcus faecium]|uniref:Bax inhibitor-1/YccA family protein n=1 Tax=Enterococcus faecium TaxID=1352 RepID=UPI000CF2CFF7|nr:Bax inhibitor-1/YccA family protein [Enterococcus faecium]MDQ8268943.1 Bax inhibitor-1/YccA family protein [Enterococcus faecium]MDT2322611.1 Bax inhibitor-1/YccA family protein [Enterococcus faecium]MDV7692881.1 Bax inhibitor-1/YccA family protein [Enterococcus faecium]MDV7721586.1 Bax inhibitor-1/YccA family protein [Enterococcus faecium]MDW3702596.1 Bax inhibitor-1/YccA family protein [Enterococcus faecium]